MSPTATVAGPRTIAGLTVEDIDSIIADGRALPAAFYTSPEFRALEDEMIFAHAWQLVGSRLDFAAAGDYVTTKIAQVPVVVVRDDSGELNAFVNVCRHRASTVMEGSGSCRRMQCGYHGWTYGLDGSLRGVPKFAEGNLPPFETLGLRPIHLETFAGLVFVALEPIETLAEQLGDMPQMLERAGYDFPFDNPDLELQSLGGPADYDGVVRGNWKVFYENSSECYHCPSVHQETVCEVMRDEDIQIEVNPTGRFGMVAGLPLKPEWQERVPSGKAGSPFGFAIYSFWPNTILFSGHAGEHLTRYEPAGPGGVRYWARSYSRPDQDLGVLNEMLDVLFVKGNDEDMAVVEATQTGLESGYYSPGPLMQGPERVIGSFQRHVWDALRPALAEGA
ncbi:aromatic ring-hydroxylating dioxygenase subunit alpha [Aeromicrobium sp. CTD01-1L150]|uniref:aromatic ring-hydroxylating oxygenase subunit alpha n=1 Tax=Aeromicrobium sp. CTD01-1L150 TaxID=3341830 RepID=UPI0035C0538D